MTAIFIAIGITTVLALTLRTTAHLSIKHRERH